MSPIGDWFLNHEGKWTYDANAPTEATSAMPAVKPDLTFVKDDGSVYARVDPDWFDSYDNVDSRTVEDDGGPPDAA